MFGGHGRDSRFYSESGRKPSEAFNKRSDKIWLVMLEIVLDTLLSTDCRGAEGEAGRPARPLLRATGVMVGPGPESAVTDMLKDWERE